MKLRDIEKNISSHNLERYRKIGFYLLLLDYAFISYLLYNMVHIYNLFITILGVRRVVVFNYAIIINVFQFPVILFIVFIMLSIKYQPIASRQLTLGFKKILLPLIFISTFSLFFADKIQEFIPKLPDQYQNNILFKYYLSYLLMILFFSIRIIFSFNYFQLFYLIDKIDLRFHFAIITYLLLIVSGV
ncbi:hypothetical protein DV702_08715 [Sporosarcina sp. PTS2304]|nr:hypothetical protein DV702_08715 [Sporosarcina sp. PTS2304]